jgi:hypothetical protein
MAKVVPMTDPTVVHRQGEDDRQSARTPPAAGTPARWRATVRDTSIIAAAVTALALLAGIYINTSPTADGKASTKKSPVDMVTRLTAGVQVGTYIDLLGNPLIKRPIQQTKFIEWIWRQPEFVLQALVDDLGQVSMYTLTSTKSDFHPVIPMVRGPHQEELRLGIATFSQVDGTDGSEAVYPANAKYHYSELISGGGATHGRSLVVTNSWDGTAVPTPSVGAVDELNQAIDLCGLSAFGFTACKTTEPTAQATLAKLREDLHISGFTLTAPDFDPKTVEVNRSPWIMDSACDVPEAC